ncbi:MAG TPA: DUF3568 family protein [Gemmataceae bacterium]|nr:DUF3568 family protein [Gemmataceae bacterium]
MLRRGRSRWLWAAYLGLAALALGNAGCLVAAAGGAAAGVAGYAYYKGKVYRTYVANVEDVRLATRKALGELQMPITKDEGSPKGGEIEAYHDKDKIVIALEVEDSPMAGSPAVTQVGIRVATFGNEGLSERIHDQISFHLIPPAAVPVPPKLIAPPPLAPPPQSPPPPVAQQSAAPPLAK